MTWYKYAKKIPEVMLQQRWFGAHLPARSPFCLPACLPD
jgi:hypothetical protein